MSFLRINSREFLSTAIDTGLIDAATHIDVTRDARIDELPAFPRATHVLLQGLGLKALPDMPLAHTIRLRDLPAISDVSCLSNAREIQMIGMTAVSHVPDMHGARYVWFENCPMMSSLPAIPVAEFIHIAAMSGLDTLAEMPRGTHICLFDLPNVAAHPDAPMAKQFFVRNVPNALGRPVVPPDCDIRLNGEPWC